MVTPPSQTSQREVSRRSSPPAGSPGSVDVAASRKSDRHARFGFHACAGSGADVHPSRVGGAASGSDTGTARVGGAASVSDARSARVGDVASGSEIASPRGDVAASAAGAVSAGDGWGGSDAPGGGAAIRASSDSIRALARPSASCNAVARRNATTARIGPPISSTRTRTGTMYANAIAKASRFRVGHGIATVHRRWPSRDPAAAPPGYSQNRHVISPRRGRHVGRGCRGRDTSDSRQHPERPFHGAILA